LGRIHCPTPDDPTLRYGGAGRSEDKLRHFTNTPFYQALLPETQNILRHIRRVEWLRPPQADALELYIYLKEVRGNPTTQQLYRDVLLGDIEGKPALELTADELERLRAAQAQIKAIEETLMGVDYPNAIYSLVEEVARFTGLCCLEVERILRQSDAGLEGMPDYVNHVEYYDEQAGRWRKFFPDFFLRLADDGWMVIEVKREDQTVHPNVKAKDTAARRVFEALNGIFYHVKPDDEIRRGDFHDIFQRVMFAPAYSGRVNA